jgi:hypothetical protein
MSVHRFDTVVREKKRVTVAARFRHHPYDRAGRRGVHRVAVQPSGTHIHSGVQRAASHLSQRGGKLVEPRKGPCQALGRALRECEGARRTGKRRVRRETRYSPPTAHAEQTHHHRI